MNYTQFIILVITFSSFMCTVVGLDISTVLDGVWEISPEHSLAFAQALRLSGVMCVYWCTAKFLVSLSPTASDFDQIE